MSNAWVNSTLQLQAFSRLLTFGRDSAVGATQMQQSQPSAQKLTRQKCRAIDPSGLLIVYSLGDELYKWCPVEGIHEPFHSKLDKTYTFPSGWRRHRRACQDHLANFNQNGFDGRAALQAALDWKALEGKGQGQHDLAPEFARSGRRTAT